MPDCVYLSRDMVRVDAGGSTCCGNTVDVHRCLSQDQSSEWCVPAKSFDGSLSAVADVDGKSSRISAVSCDKCSDKVYPQILPPLQNGVKSKTRLMWEKVHFREDLFVPESSSAIVIDCTRNGYGDAICAAWISEYHKKSDRKVLLHATGNMKRVAESLGQTVVDKTGSMFSLNSTWSADSASRLNSDRLATWCSMLGLDLKWSRPSICIPSEELIAAESFRTPGRKLAMICPRSTHTQREWPKQYWNELKQILQSEGFDVVTFGVDGEYVDVLPSVGKSWTLCAAVAKVCDIVIGIDSAPIHWCGTANAKCLAIMGPTTDGVFAHMSNVHCISVAKRQMPCVGCWMYGPYHDSMACNISCSAMSNVLPGEVAGAVMELCNV